jgi:hypothetical protein
MTARPLVATHQPEVIDQRKFRGERHLNGENADSPWGDVNAAIENAIWLHKTGGIAQVEC